MKMSSQVFGYSDELVQHLLNDLQQRPDLIGEKNVW